eukprot:s7578_g4.t1
MAIHPADRIVTLYVECLIIVLRFEPSVVPTAALYMRSSKARSPKPLWAEYKTFDLTGAFDAVPRHRLLEGMHRMQLPPSFIQLVMCWHHNAHYHINHDGTDRVIHATQGVRQGCAVAPLLWLIFSHLISDTLAAKIGYQATVDLLSIFADDYHCSGEFQTVHELEVTLERIAALLHTLAEMGMLVSPSKSKAILRRAGPGEDNSRAKPPQAKFCAIAVPISALTYRW